MSACNHTSTWLRRILVLFLASIEQIVDPADLVDGYYATGSELFVLDGTGAVSYLTHGGHLWDHAY